jgi:hypothetical protein
VIALRFESELAAAPDTVWRRVTSVEGIADEMTPLLRMTFPAAALRHDLKETP